MKKYAGILLPLFSVPGNQGIGDLGKKTIMMIDELVKAGYSIWSMLPITAMQKDNNPYSAASSFAGDPIYINIDRLAEMGLLTQSSIINCNKFKNFVDYDTVRAFKEPYFQRAFKAFRKNYSRFKSEFEEFKKEAFWLNSWTAYEVFRMSHEGKGWSEWEPQYQNWPEKQEVNLREYVEKVFYVQFLQFIFYRQLDEISQRARDKGLILMQDVPFYSNLDSAEVWYGKRHYMVRADGTMRSAAGMPPDPSMPEGIVWDKPSYNLDVMRDENYEPFRQRVRWTARNFDGIRLEHFRGFDSVWKVPDARRADTGKMAAGPGRDLLDLLRSDNPGVLFTAEDLGPVKASMRELEMSAGIPGMDLLQERMETKLLKKPAIPMSVVYTSTISTPTLEEEYGEYTNNHKIALRRFFKKRGYDHRPFHDLVNHFALSQDAQIVFLNVSDIVGAKGNARIDDPLDETRDNWTWKLKDYKEFPGALAVTREWIEESGRLPGREKPVRAVSEEPVGMQAEADEPQDDE